MEKRERMMEFAGVTMATVARDTLKMFLEHPKIGPLLNEQGKKGGYVCFGEVGFGIFSVSMIGSHPRTKSSSFNVVAKKAQYLLEHPNALMSREGRDPAQELWGGGLRIPGSNAVIAFSGFPEHLDELFVMMIAVRLKLMKRGAVLELLREFPNDYAKLDDGNTLFV